MDQQDNTLFQLEKYFTARIFYSCNDYLDNDNNNNDNDNNNDDNDNILFDHKLKLQPSVVQKTKLKIGLEITIPTNWSLSWPQGAEN